jgi:hypothetical protein
MMHTGKGEVEEAAVSVLQQWTALPPMMHTRKGEEEGATVAVLQQWTALPPVMHTGKGHLPYPYSTSSLGGGGG